MEAYKVLTHPSKRIDYDNKLRMYRRGDFNVKREIKVERIKKGAFIETKRIQEKVEKKKVSAAQKADELIDDFYKETTHTPAYLKHKTEFPEKITHTVKLKVKRNIDKIGVRITQNISGLMILQSLWAV